MHIHYILFKRSRFEKVIFSIDSTRFLYAVQQITKGSIFRKYITEFCHHYIQLKLFQVLLILLSFCHGTRAFLFLSRESVNLNLYLLMINDIFSWNTRVSRHSLFLKQLNQTTKIGYLQE